MLTGCTSVNSSLYMSISDLTLCSATFVLSFYSGSHLDLLHEPENFSHFPSALYLRSKSFWAFPENYVGWNGAAMPEVRLESILSTVVWLTAVFESILSTVVRFLHFSQNLSISWDWIKYHLVFHQIFWTRQYPAFWLSGSCKLFAKSCPSIPFTIVKSSSIGNVWLFPSLSKDGSSVMSCLMYLSQMNRSFSITEADDTQIQ